MAGAGSVRSSAGHVDRLDRRDRAALGRRDALLQLAHLGRQRRLVPDGRRHAAQQRGDLGAGLREPEDVVDEQQDVLALVAEVLRSGQAGEPDAEARSGRLVHLAVDQAGLLDDAGVAHLDVEVGALTGALADAAEHRRAAVRHREVVDELLDDDGLADARAAEQAGLAALDVGLEQVDDLDAGLEDLGGRLEVLVLGGLAVDRVVGLDLGHRLAVDRLAEHVPDAAERGRADRHHHRAAGVDGLHPALDAVGGRHRDGADDVALEVLLDLGGDVDRPDRRRRSAP